MLKTTVTGSLPKPAWLAQPEVLWAPWATDDPARLEEAKHDAVRLAIRDQEEAGLCRDRYVANSIAQQTRPAPNHCISLNPSSRRNPAIISPAAGTIGVINATNPVPSVRTAKPNSVTAIKAWAMPW